MSEPETEFPPLPATKSIPNHRKQESWVKVAQNKSSLSQHTVEVALVDGSELIEIPDAVIQNSVPLWEDFLVGRFLEPAPHVAKIHVIVNKIWPLGDKNIRIDVFAVNTTTVKFRIRDTAARSMWNIADIPMVISKWSPIAEEEEPEIKTMPMWITLKNVPHKMFSWDGLGFLSSAVGKPVRLHPDTELCTNFEEAKVFVEADMTKELPAKRRFTSKTLGIDAVVEFSYPWLPPRCTLCSKWGHLKKDCIAKRGDKQIQILKNTASSSAAETENTKEVEAEVTVVDKEPEKDSTKSVATSSDVQAVEAGLNLVSESPEISTENDHEAAIIQKAQNATDDKPSEEMSAKSVPVDISEQDGWSVVSPGKSRRSGEKKSNDIEVIVSPSRFAVLNEDVCPENKTDANNVADDLAKTGHLGEEEEEGEIPQSEIKDRQDKQNDNSIRQSIPRQKKGTNNFRSESYVLSTTVSKPIAPGKKKPKKT